MMVTDDRQ